MGVKKIWSLICYGCCCALLLVGCKSASRPVQQIVEKDIKGNWVCSEALSQVAQTKSIKRLKNFPPYTEFIFAHDSSRLLVALNGQVDMITLSYSYLYGEDALQVFDLDGNEEAYIKIVNDSTLLLSDKFSTETWSYVRVPSASVAFARNVDVPEVFPVLLNQALIAGDYTVQNVDEPYSVVLRSNGYIAYSPDFTSYSLCYNGSCNTYSNEDLIYLSNEQNGDYYGWQMQDSTLTIYSLLSVSMPDEITEYKLDKPILVMKKNMRDAAAKTE